MKQDILPPAMDLMITGATAGAITLVGARGYHQFEPHTCGAAAVATVLHAQTGNVTDEQWQTIVQATAMTEEHGTQMRGLCRGLRAVGIPAIVRKGSLHNAAFEALTNGDVLVTTVRMRRQKAGETHWVVVVGWRPDGLLLLNCTGLPWFTQRWYSLDKLKNRASPDDSIILAKTNVKDYVVNLYDGGGSSRKVS